MINGLRQRITVIIKCLTIFGQHYMDNYVLVKPGCVDGSSVWFTRTPLAVQKLKIAQSGLVK